MTPTPNPTAEKVIADAITAYWADEKRSGPNRGPEAHDRECGIDAAKALRAHGLLSEGAVCEHQNEDYLRMMRERDEALAKLSEGAPSEDAVELRVMKDTAKRLLHEADTWEKSFGGSVYARDCRRGAAALERLAFLVERCDAALSDERYERQRNAFLWVRGLAVGGEQDV